MMESLPQLVMVSAFAGIGTVAIASAWVIAELEKEVSNDE